MTQPNLIASRTPADDMLAGTLCLMSCYTQNPMAVFAERIAGNLAGLAGDARLTAELRAICARLSARWLQIGREARQHEDGQAVTDLRSIH